jgi:hypothetical protein
MCATSIHVAAGLVQSHDAAAGAQSPAPRIPPAAASEGVAVGRVSSRFRGLCHDKKHDTWRVRIFYLGKQVGVRVGVRARLAARGLCWLLYTELSTTPCRTAQHRMHSGT